MLNIRPWEGSLAEVLCNKYTMDELVALSKNKNADVRECTKRGITAKEWHRQVTNALFTKIVKETEDKSERNHEYFI